MQGDNFNHKDMSNYFLCDTDELFVVCCSNNDKIPLLSQI